AQGATDTTRFGASLRAVPMGIVPAGIDGERQPRRKIGLDDPPQSLTLGPHDPVALVAHRSLLVASLDAMRRRRLRSLGWRLLIINREAWRAIRGRAGHQLRTVSARSPQPGAVAWRHPNCARRPRFRCPRGTGRSQRGNRLEGFAPRAGLA